LAGAVFGENGMPGKGWRRFSPQNNLRQVFFKGNFKSSEINLAIEIQR